MSYLSRPLDVSCSLRHVFSNLKLQRLCEDIKYCCDLLTGPKRIDYSSCGFDILGEGGKGGGRGRLESHAWEGVCEPPGACHHSGLLGRHVNPYIRFYMTVM